MDQLNGPPQRPCTIPCILVAGGAGYIGSNTVLELLTRNNCTKQSNCLQPLWEVVVVDNLKNSNISGLVHAQQIANRKIHAFHQIDLLDKNAVQKVFSLHPEIWGIIHFASAKSVPESWSNPLLYYNLNLGSTLNLLECCAKSSREIHFVFSSSACVYGESLDEQQYNFNGNHVKGVTEDCPAKPKSPYGRTKLIIEDMIRDVCATYTKGAKLRAAILRYFNPVGAHASGYLGENNGTQEPSNLVPIVTRLARKIKRENFNSKPATTTAAIKPFKIYGRDWPTPDGTPIRDFLHITDLATSHVFALEHLLMLSPPSTATPDSLLWNCVTYNIGCGIGHSVLQVVKTVEKISGVEIPIEVCGRREGDVGVAISDSTKAMKELHWKSERTLEVMCQDAWNFEMLHLEPEDVQLWKSKQPCQEMEGTNTSVELSAVVAAAAEHL
ncbi:UDP-glucose 4-epimerase [Obelidium mucronatum]|nr:UDP-glucose 4-epimerase [Obelidium mucronatum]